MALMLKPLPHGPRNVALLKQIAKQSIKGLDDKSKTMLYWLIAAWVHQHYGHQLLRVDDLEGALIKFFIAEYMLQKVQELPEYEKSLEAAARFRLCRIEEDLEADISRVSQTIQGMCIEWSKAHPSAADDPESTEDLTQISKEQKDTGSMHVEGNILKLVNTEQVFIAREVPSIGQSTEPLSGEKHAEASLDTTLPSQLVTAHANNPETLLGPELVIPSYPVAAPEAANTIHREFSKKLKGSWTNRLSGLFRPSKRDSAIEQGEVDGSTSTPVLLPPLPKSVAKRHTQNLPQVAVSSSLKTESPLLQVVTLLPSAHSLPTNTQTPRAILASLSRPPTPFRERRNQQALSHSPSRSPRPIFPRDQPPGGGRESPRSLHMGSPPCSLSSGQSSSSMRSTPVSLALTLMSLPGMDSPRGIASYLGYQESLSDSTRSHREPRPRFPAP